jgi:hypothetical protein
MRISTSFVMTGPDQGFQRTTAAVPFSSKAAFATWFVSAHRAAAASGQLPHFPATLFEHVGEVYRRVETAANLNLAGLEALRLAARIHEEPQESLPKVLDSAGVFDFAPIVVAVTGGFGGTDIEADGVRGSCD